MLQYVKSTLERGYMNMVNGLDKKNNIRIIEMSLHDFMNVEEGTVKFSCSRSDGRNFGSADILGLYGQNGSGKTAFIHALSVIKKCMMGMKLGPETSAYIRNGAESLRIHIGFSARVEERIIDLFYDVAIHRVNDENQAGAQISSEVLSIRDSGGRKHVLLSCDDEAVLRPKKIFTNFSRKNNTDLHVKRGIVRSQGRSFIFSRELYDFLKSIGDSESVQQIFFSRDILKKFAREYLYVIGVKDIGVINLSIAMPFYFHIQDEGIHSFGAIPIRINGPASIRARDFRLAERFIDDMNSVLKYLIPGLQLQLKNIGDELNENGEQMKRVELLSIRNNKAIPLKYESEGIKKILSILHVFIGAFNDSSMTVVIDEFDAGVFEYLLGELLELFAESGKGQLIFTSHNLRPLEVLNKDFIVFTTTNPKDRYVRLKNVKSNNNLRDFYYHTILLGGQDEYLYNETNQYELSYAIRKVGKYEKE